MLKSVILGSLMLISQVFGRKEHLTCTEINIKENVKACDGTDHTKMLKCVRNPNLSISTWEFDSTCGYCCNMVYPVIGSYCADSESVCKKQQQIQDKLMSQDPDAQKLEALDESRFMEFKNPNQT